MTFALRTLLVFATMVSALAGAIAAARTAGRQTPPSPTFLDTGHCDLPCWQGLQPGLDSTNQFLFRVRQTGPYSGRTTDYGDGIAARFELLTFGAISLADVIREYGSPERVGCLGTDHSALYPGRTLVTSVEVYFAGGLVVVNAVRPDDAPRLTPDMDIRAIDYYGPGEPAYEVGATTDWHGFASTRRYQLCHP
jgi:hypothetical protein